MSDAKKDDHKKDPGEPKPPKFGMLKLVPVVLVFSLANLGATGFTVFKLLTAHPPAAAAAAAEGGGHGEEATKSDHEEKGGDHGGGEFSEITVAMEPFVVNLNEPGANRYLKATFEIEVRDQKGGDAVNKAKSLVRDDVLRYLSGLRVADTQGEANKSRILDEVKDRLDGIVGKRKVERVFITEFVVQ